MLNALLPRTRQNILAALLLSPERRWYLSDLAQHLGVTPSSLQRELASLTSVGILERMEDRSRVYYQANVAHPLFPDLQSIFTKTVGIVGRTRAALEPFWGGIEIAFIFGSIARGERTIQSDVDVLIVGSIGMAELALPLRALEQTLQIPVNVTQYTLTEFQDKITRNNHFLQTILQGRKIFLKGSDDELAITLSESATQDAYYEQAGVG